MNKVFFCLLIAFGVIIVACKKENDDGIVASMGDDANLRKLGGDCSVDNSTTYAFSLQINGLSSSDELNLFNGNSFFNQNWVTAPSSTTARDGLGPLFNATSCAGCHNRDGRGAPFTGQGMLFRLGSQTDNSPDPIYGGQLQDYSILGVSKEGTMDISYVEIPGTYDDGTPYSLRMPSYSISNLAYGPLDANTGISPRVGQQMIGLGLLEIIPSSQILANADPNDSNGDGISGKANYAMDIETGQLKLGRFGWKANVPTIGHQVAGAFQGDLSIKSTYFTAENYTSNQPSCDGLPNGGTPEVLLADLQAVMIYARTLAVPYRRNTNNAEVKEGAKLFRSANCIACHKMEFQTGKTGNINALKRQRIVPYTDLLLHDMGPEMADDVPDHLASGSEWRTQPLWGLGLISTVNSHTYLLHDGRARSIAEAILWHGGEGTASKNAFKAMSATQRAQLLAYLESL